VATRRKNKSNHAPADVNVAVVAAPEPQAAPSPPSHQVNNSVHLNSDDGNPLQRALEAQQHAEHLQHQHAQRGAIGLPEPPINPTQRQAIDAHIDSIADLTDHKRRFLKSHPSLLNEPYRQSMAHAHHLALHAGVPDDTPAMDHAVLAGVARDIQHHHALSAANGQGGQGQHPTPSSLSSPDHLAAELAQPAPIAPPPQRKSSMPFSAPVSRDVPSGYRGPSDRNTLSAEEVQIARASITDPTMSNAKKELLYLKNRNRYRAMKANGSYSDQGGG
jgi:hypothetical protein